MTAHNEYMPAYPVTISVRNRLAARSVSRLLALALASILVGAALPGRASAADPFERGFVIAQSSLGGPGPEQLPPSIAPTPTPPGSSPRTDYIPPNLRPNRQPPPGIEPPGNSPRTDYIPPQLNPTPQPPANSGDTLWGAIAFTAGGAYSVVWRMPAQSDAEVKALKQCSSFNQGGCEVTSFSGQECVALATFVGNYRRRRWLLSYTAGGMSSPEAQRAAVDRCNADERTQGKCVFRTAACADWR
jgi:hypothetical protein